MRWTANEWEADDGQLLRERKGKQGRREGGKAITKRPPPTRYPPSTHQAASSIFTELWLFPNPGTLKYYRPTLVKAPIPTTNDLYKIKYLDVGPQAQLPPPYAEDISALLTMHSGFG